MSVLKDKHRPQWPRIALQPGLNLFLIFLFLSFLCRRTSILAWTSALSNSSSRSNLLLLMTRLPGTITFTVDAGIKTIYSRSDQEQQVKWVHQNTHLTLLVTANILPQTLVNTLMFISMLMTLPLFCCCSSSKELMIRLIGSFCQAHFYATPGPPTRGNEGFPCSIFVWHR